MVVAVFGIGLCNGICEKGSFSGFVTNAASASSSKSLVGESMTLYRFVGAKEERRSVNSLCGEEEGGEDVVDIGLQLRVGLRLRGNEWGTNGLGVKYNDKCNHRRERNSICTRRLDDFDIYRDVTTNSAAVWACLFESLANCSKHQSSPYEGNRTIPSQPDRQSVASYYVQYLEVL